MICPNCKIPMKEASCNKSNMICPRCGLMQKDTINPEAEKVCVECGNSMNEEYEGQWWCKTCHTNFHNEIDEKEPTTMAIS